MSNVLDLRVLFFGTLGQFSIPPLEALLRAGVTMCGIAVPALSSTPPRIAPDISRWRNPAPQSSLPIINPFVTRDITTIAWEHEIPVFEVHKLHTASTLDTIAQLQPAVGCVACFPRRLPKPLLDLMPLGWFNIHPSMLPAYRGPAPLFWIMRDGTEAAGVTIHVMDEHFDTGGIVAQQRVNLPDGVDGPTADNIIARQGGDLLLDVLTALRQGALICHPQPGGGTTAPWPSADDFRLSLDWSARHAYNFMRGTAEWEQPYQVSIGDQQLLLAAAIDYSLDEHLGAPFVRISDTVRIQFGQGVLAAVLA